MFLTLPAGSTTSQVPQGPQQVSCRAWVRGGLGEAITVTRELVIEPPLLPDFTFSSVRSLPFGAFDCDNYAPPIATRNTCVAFESHDLGRTTAAGAQSVRCTVDGHLVHDSPGPYHSGAFLLGRLSEGHHILRCTTTAPEPAWEADLSNNALEVAFEVGDVSRWHYDLAIDAVDSSTRPTRVAAPQQVGPTRDVPLPSVPGIAFGVRVKNVGSMRVFAVQVSCNARLTAGEQTTFYGNWSRASEDREWLRGLEPGEDAVVEVATPGSFPKGILDVVCDVRAGAPRDVPDLNAGNNQRHALVSNP